MDDNGRDEPGDTPEPGHDDPDRAGWAAPPPASPPPPPPGGAPPWAGEPTAPTPTPPPPAWGPQPPPPPAWGQQPPPPGWSPQPPAPPAWGSQPPSPPGWGAPPGQGGWGAPAPQGPSPQPGKKRGWAWLWALIVTLVVLFGVAIAATVVAVGAFTKPADATNAYLRDLRDGQYAAAYAHLCAARRDETSFAEFRAQQQSRSTEDRIEEVDVYSSILHGSGHTATTRYTLNRFLSRERWEVQLVKEGGQWRLCHFTQLAY